MDLISGQPHWPRAAGQLCTFPPLSDDLRCEVAVMGAGVTGALVAAALSRAGLDTVVLDRRDVASGSSSASTGLLQYEIDTHLIDLIARYGRAPAELAYRACRDAIDTLRQLDAGLGCTGHWMRKRSLYLASRRRDVDTLRQEAAARTAAGIAVQVLEASAVRAHFDLEAPLALLSADAAEIDPFRFACALLNDGQTRGVRVFDRTTVEQPRRQPDGDWLLRTDREAAVRARHVVVATGYESGRFLPGPTRMRIRSSYAFVTEPMALPEPLKNTLVWESARPYLYLRTTVDQRLMIGGEDDAIDIAVRRDLRVPGKTRTLRRRVARWWPELPLEVGCAWAGSFAETFDGLPLIGQSARAPAGLLMALAFGGNGIVFSALAAEMLTAAVQGRKHPLAGVFHPDR